MASKPYVIHGATEGKNPHRREIQELMADEYQFSLFMQALENLKKKDYKPDPVSWQQIAGIHGLPYARWSGDPDGQPQPGDKEQETPNTGSLQWQGYCYHASVLFPTWHRVLLLLVEQALTDEAKTIAESIIKSNTKMSSDERNQWLIASRLLRFPFWDWSSRNAELYGLPQIIHKPQVTVRGPHDSKILLSPNPLAFYEFSEIPAGVDKLPPEYETKHKVYFKQWKRTYRWAYKTEGVDDPWAEDYEKLNDALKNGQKRAALRDVDSISMMCDKLRRMFSFPAADAESKRHAMYWDYFADAAPQSCPKSADGFSEPIYRSTYSSLESPHNSMHVNIGGSGDMAFNEMAGFDPVFYLHHCNVDRLYALWEYVYPEYWMGSKGYYKEYEKGQFDGPYDFQDKEGTYQGDPGAVIKAETGLAPFRRTEAQYWTSEELRGLIPSKLSPQTYSYPPVVLPTENGQVTIDVTQPADLEARQLYITALQEYYRDLSPKNAPSKAKPGMFFSPVDRSDIPETHTPVEGYRDFVVVGFLQQFAFRGSHRLQLYLDGVWVNEISVFSRMLPERCQNCVGRIASGNAFVRGAMGLPYAVVVQALEKEGKNAEETTDEEVIEVLKRRLSAKIVAPNGTLLAEHAAPSQADSGEVSAQGLMARKDTPAFYLSSARLLESDDRKLPSEFFDWQDHGSVLDASWRLA